MKYFIDFEFLEGDVPQEIFGTRIPRWLSKPNNTIQPISIGICSSDGREYYAISKDFNLKEAWNRYDLKPDIINGGMKEVYWLRDNVLKPIWVELSLLKNPEYSKNDIEFVWSKLSNRERYIRMKLLLLLYGKTNKQITDEIKEFIAYSEEPELHPQDYYSKKDNWSFNNVQFYGYYSDYDWVVFCWLFDKMIDLPKGFPMYCIDLKQTLDEKAYKENKLHQDNYIPDFYYGKTKDDMIEFWKKHHPNYPKQTNEHSAIHDARWNKQLHEFLNKL